MFKNNLNLLPCNINKFCTIIELSTKECWTQHKYSDSFNKFWNFTDNCERVLESKCSIKQFITNYEALYKPVVIEGCEKEWKANYKWTLEKLVKNTAIRNLSLEKIMRVTM